MKVNIQPIKGVKFGNMFRGECFIHAGNYYLKTDSNDCGNAVKLTTGEHFTFMNNDRVLPLDAELHVFRKEDNETS